MRVTIEKIEGVESVEVSLNEGLAKVRLGPANRVGLRQILEAVRRNGFTPRDAEVSVRARVEASPNQLRLHVLQTTDVLNVAAPVGPETERTTRQLGGLSGSTVVVRGTVSTAKEGEPLVIEIKAVAVR